MMACSAYDCMIPARGKGVAKTDLQIAIPSGTYARVAPRSGLAVKHFIDTGAGVVDEDYRGNVGVVLFNHSDTDFKSESNRLCAWKFASHEWASFTAEQSCKKFNDAVLHGLNMCGCVVCRPCIAA